MRKLPPTAAEELLEIVMRRYERTSTVLTSNRPEVLPLVDAERQMIERALAVYDGRVDEAAQALGIPRSSLYAKIKRFGLKK
jgi:transcriptional regulator of acetoin/glycerol metabolism